MLSLFCANMLKLVVTLCLAAAVHVLADYPAPPQTFDAHDYTKWSDVVVGESKRAEIDINFDGGDYIKLYRLDLVGDAKARGFAHGSLLAKEIAEFCGPALDNFFSEMVLDIDTSGLPDWLATLVSKIATGKKAPGAIHKALDWVWKNEEKYVPQRLIDEIGGIAEGMCSVMGDSCDIEEQRKLIQSVNMLPELIRMSCTAFGAWGKATGGGLLQLRALDFGPGPFANYTVVATSRANSAGEGPKDAFVSVQFPGMVGVITGVSQSGIGVSEKVWMTHDTPDLQPGSYDGEADVFVLRDILENSPTKEEAEEYMRNAKRTWGMWVGTGDYKSGEFDLTGYRQEDAVTYNDKTMPSMTGGPYIESVCYVDKHPQPSTDDILPTALQAFWGSINVDTTKQIVQAHTTGDVHAAAYDFTKNLLTLTIGKIDAVGNYVENGKAYDRPWTLFKLSDLFSGK